MKAHVIGFDLSLTAPAAVALPLDWRPGDWKRVKSWLEKPKAPKSADLAGQVARYQVIAAWASDVLREVREVKLVAVENYGFSKNNASAHRLMELGGVVRHMLLNERGHVMVPIAANTARKLLLGKCPREEPKIAVQRALFDAGAPKTWEENICDAMAVVNVALSNAGGVALMLHAHPGGLAVQRSRLRLPVT